MGATRVLRIIDVYGMQAIDTHHAVELVEYAVQIMDDVVAGIAHMAGVQTNAQLIGQLWALGGNALDNARQFFKATAHLGALPAMVSSNTVVCCPSNITRHSVSTII